MTVRAHHADAGLRLDAFLVAKGEVDTRAAAQRAIDGGRVTVNGAARPKSHRIAAGDGVDIAAAEVDDGAGVPAAAFTVVYEDDGVLVVDKPAGVVVHPGAGHAHGTLVQALEGRVAGGPDPARPGVVHRLDMDTSGLLVLARTEPAYVELQRAIAAREVERNYLALVDGRPDARSGTIDAPLGRDRARRTAMSTDTDSPRAAVTHFTLREALPHTTLLDVTLETGRTHQIRAHLTAIGHPVCGDARYGGAAAGRRIGLERQWLHARRLMFAHPLTGEEIVCESKPPADLDRSLDRARREPVSGGPDGG